MNFILDEMKRGEKRREKRRAHVYGGTVEA